MNPMKKLRAILKESLPDKEIALDLQFEVR